MSRTKVIVGLIFSLVFVYLIFYIPHPGQLLVGRIGLYDAFFKDSRFNLTQVGQALSEVRMVPLWICFLLTPVHVWIRSHRWSLMVNGMGKLRVMDSYSIQMVGYLANSVLPLRIGEVVRGILLAKRMKTSMTGGFGTVILERVLDMVTLLILVLIVSILFPFPRIISEAAILFGLFAAVSLGITFYLGYVRDPFDHWPGRLVGSGRIGNIVRKQLGQISTSFSMWQQTEHHLVIISETALIWMLYAAQGYLVLYAFDFMEKYPLIGSAPILASFVILAMNSIGVSVPSAPAGVGTFHAVLIFGLSLFDVPASEAAGFAVVIHAVTVAFYIVFGLPMMWREGLHLSELKSIKAPNGLDSSGGKPIK